MRIARMVMHYSRPVREAEEKLIKEGHVPDPSLVFHGSFGMDCSELLADFISQKLLTDARNIVLVKDSSLRLSEDICKQLGDVVNVDSVLPYDKKIKVFVLARADTHAYRRINELRQIDYQTDNIHSLASKLSVLRKAVDDGSFFKVLSNLIRDSGYPQLSDIHLIADRCFLGHIPDNIFHGYSYTRFTTDEAAGGKLKIICLVPELNEAVMEKAKSIASALNIEEVDDAIINCQQEVLDAPPVEHRRQEYYDHAYEQILDKAGIIDPLTHFIVDANVYKYISRKINNDGILHVVI